MVHKSTTEADRGSILLYYFCSSNHSRMTLNYTDEHSCTSRKATATKLMIKKLFTIETHWWLYRLQNIERSQFRSTWIYMILQKMEATSQERSRALLMHLFIESINQDTHTKYFMTHFSIYNRLSGQWSHLSDTDLTTVRSCQPQSAEL